MNAKNTNEERRIISREEAEAFTEELALRLDELTKEQRAKLKRIFPVFDPAKFDYLSPQALANMKVLIESED